MIRMHQTLPCSGRDRVLCVLFALVCCLVWPGVSLAVLDICGCTGLPSLGAFDSSNSSTYPPGTTISGANVTLPLPPDGTLVFSSFTVANTHPVFFRRNNANTPVTLLVTGNVTIGSSLTSAVLLDVSGSAGSNVSTSSLGLGGLGGHGGLRGGDGAYPVINLANNGGTGLGLGGGAGGTAAPLTSGGHGTFGGSFQLLPLIGGSGGGGGAASSNTSSCAGGGGGGGGGALLIAANGTITLDAVIDADGGNVGNSSSSSCSSLGGGGSGGAVRLLANTITSTSTSSFDRIVARGGIDPFVTGTRAGAGSIRMEAFTNTLAADLTDPLAQRIGGPGPVIVSIPQTIAITMVDGQSVPQLPRGSIGVIDLIILVPGVIPIDLETLGVPGGTVVAVKVKPQVGGAPIVQNVTLAPSNCFNDGHCAATVMVNLPAGQHFVEAQATFRTP